MANKNIMLEGSIKIDSEKVVERKLRESVKQHKGLCIKLLPDFFSGLPDRIVLLPGANIFFIELKTTKIDARKLQKIVHDKLRDLGFKVYVIDTIEGALSIVDLHMKGE